MVSKSSLFAGQKRFSRKGEGGFTLLEVMVALTVFTGGMVSIMALFIAGIALHREAAARTRAVLMAERILVEVEEEISKAFQSSAQIPPAGMEVPVSSDFPGFRGVARIFPLEAHWKQEGGPVEVLVQVEIFWKKRGEERGSTFYSILPWGESFAEKVRKIVE